MCGGGFRGPTVAELVLLNWGYALKMGHSPKELEGTRKVKDIKDLPFRIGQAEPVAVKLTQALRSFALD